MLTGSDTVARSEAVVTEAVGEELFLYDMCAGKVFVFGAVGALIWHLLDDRRDLASVAQVITDTFEVSGDDAFRDTREFVAQLMASSLAVRAADVGVGFIPTLLPEITPAESRAGINPAPTLADRLQRQTGINPARASISGMPAADGAQHGLGPGLRLCLEGWPGWCREPVLAFLDHTYHAERSSRGRTLPWRFEGSSRGLPGKFEERIEDGPLVVEYSKSRVDYTLPGIHGWCDLAEVRAGVSITGPDRDGWMVFLSRIVPLTLMELAWAEGWIGLHAAAVAFEGRAVVLPAGSGAGKSTIFRNADRAGLDVLSDDHVWLRPTRDGYRVVAFPRGAPTAPEPGPTADDLPLAAFVLPSIAARWGNRLTPVPMPDVLRALVSESTVLGRRSVAASRFPQLVQAAASAPGFRLEAGHFQFSVAELLRTAGTGCFQGVQDQKTV